MFAALASCKSTCSIREFLALSFWWISYSVVAAEVVHLSSLHLVEVELEYWHVDKHPLKGQQQGCTVFHGLAEGCDRSRFNNAVEWQANLTWYRRRNDTGRKWLRTRRRTWIRDTDTNYLRKASSPGQHILCMVCGCTWSSSELYWYHARRNQQASKITKAEVKAVIDSANEETLSIRALMSKAESNVIINDPREYQLELFDKAKQENIIAVLDTGLLDATELSVHLWHHKQVLAKHW